MTVNFAAYLVKSQVKCNAFAKFFANLEPKTAELSLIHTYPFHCKSFKKESPQCIRELAEKITNCSSCMSNFLTLAELLKHSEKNREE